MAHFGVTYSNGHTEEFTRAQCHQAFNVRNFDDQQVYRVRGQVVTAETFYAEAQALCDAAWAKKAETHERKSVRYGSSAGCYVTKWVRRK